MRYIPAAIAVVAMLIIGTNVKAQTTAGAVVLTGINTANLDRAINFYTQVLGMKVAQRFPSPKLMEVAMNFSGNLNDPFVTLVFNPEHRSAYTQGDAFGRIGLRLPDVAAVIAKCRKFEGCQVTREPTASASSQQTIIGSIKDPDGFAYELIQAH